MVRGRFAGAHDQLCSGEHTVRYQFQAESASGDAERSHQHLTQRPGEVDRHRVEDHRLVGRPMGNEGEPRLPVPVRSELRPHDRRVAQLRQCANPRRTSEHSAAGQRVACGSPHRTRNARADGEGVAVHRRLQPDQRESDSEHELELR